MFDVDVVWPTAGGQHTSGDSDRTYGSSDAVPHLTADLLPGNGRSGRLFLHRRREPGSCKEPGMAAAGLFDRLQRRVRLRHRPRALGHLRRIDTQKSQRYFVVQSCT